MMMTMMQNHVTFVKSTICFSLSIPFYFHVSSHADYTHVIEQSNRILNIQYSVPACEMICIRSKYGSLIPS